MADKHFLALAGPIGSGKTTVAKLLSNRLGYELFDEPVIDNRFLGLYYGDMRRWSFTLQLEFLIKRVDHHELIRTVPKSCIQDRTLLEDPEIFAKYLHGLGHMSDDELQLYLEYFERLNRNVRQPEKIIYLQCHDVDVLLRRVQKRGRREEMEGLSREFLQGLNGFYSVFPQVVKSKYGIEIMTFDVTHFDVHDPAQANAFLALATAFIDEKSEQAA